MASTTTNYGLTKPVYTEKADVAAMNTNMDKIDTALGGLDAGIAIVANNNTHAAVSKGQYIYVRGHGTLAEGMYKAKAAIAANAALSTSNVESAVLGNDVKSLSDNTVFNVGDSYSFGGNLTSCRTLNDLSGLYFVYRLPKNIASGVTGFNITVTSASLIWGVGGASIAAGAAASNKTVSTVGVAFSFSTTGTISASGAGVCSLNATITFT